MTITLSGLPTTNRVPIVGIEIDPSRSRQGAAIKAYRALLMGFRRSTGTVAAGVLTPITGSDQGSTYFGAGSQLYEMATAWFRQGNVVETYAIALDENAGGTAAVWRVAIGGPATAAGTVYLWIGGRRLSVGVSSGDSNVDIAAAIVAAVTADPSLPVTAAVGSTTSHAELTYKHKGLDGNSLDVRVNYGSDESLPAGVTATITNSTAGATNPANITAALAAMGEGQFDVIVLGVHDATIRAEIDVELESRWGAQRQNDGTAFLGAKGSQGTLAAIGAALNSKHLVIIGADSSPSSPWSWAAASAAVAARELQADPARPLKTLPLLGILPPVESLRWTVAEANLLLYDGISTYTVDQGGTVALGRVITTYQTNGVGADDVAFLDVTSPKTLSYIRYDLRNRFATKYGRHKLGSDGNNFGAGQPVMTPKLGRAECIAAFLDYERLGLVENFAQFEDDLVVERNAQDPNRLDVLFPPDLVNQLMVVGVRLAFIL